MLGNSDQQKKKNVDQVKELVLKNITNTVHEVVNIVGIPCGKFQRKIT
jgi:hypothetical protein